MRTGVAALLCVVLAACGDDGATPADAATDDMMISDGGMPDANLMPMSLVDTGLCNDGPECRIINPGILGYAPQWQLYSDNAYKNRWIQLPPGTKIDTTDMDYWKFPVGTKVWKEFTSGNTRVETRFMMKIGEDDSLNASWYWASFVWDAANTSSTLFDASAGNPDANGTTHDVPSRSQCRRCHQNTPGRVLGFQAMSLDHSAPQGYVDLQDLVDMDLLTNDPAPTNGEFFPIVGTDVDKAAYGFMHANCGGCHNPTSTIHDTVAIEMRMEVAKLAAHDMPAFTTLVNVNAQLSMVPGVLVIPNNVADSVVTKRMMSLVPGVKMPELGTETVNTEGMTAVSAWINQPP
jgi:hypothetical protein